MAKLWSLRESIRNIERKVINVDVEATTAAWSSCRLRSWSSPILHYASELTFTFILPSLLPSPYRSVPTLPYRFSL